MNNILIRRTLVAATAGVALTGSLLASASGMGETHVSTSAQGVRTSTVSYADLDIDSAAGMEVLQRRLSQAARRVCGSQYPRQAGSLRQAAENRECYQEALSAALSEVSPNQLAVTVR